MKWAALIAGLFAGTAVAKRNPDAIVGPATIEEIMLFYVKGETL